MGSTGLISKEEKSKVEGASLSAFFEEMCPIYMSYVMSYDEFWYKNPFRAKAYRKAFEIKQERKQYG